MSQHAATASGCDVVGNATFAISRPLEQEGAEENYEVNRRRLSHLARQRNCGVSVDIAYARFKLERQVATLENIIGMFESKCELAALVSKVRQRAQVLINAETASPRDRASASGHG